MAPSILERNDMSPQSRLVAGILLILMPTVEIGGVVLAVGLLVLGAGLLRRRRLPSEG
jgi:hypothetical protein